MKTKLLSYVEEYPISQTTINPSLPKSMFKFYVNANLIVSFFNIKTFQEKIFTRSEKGKHINILV